MIVGSTTDNMTMASRGYRKDNLYPFAKAFTEAANNILVTENYDLFTEPAKTLRSPAAKEALKEFYTSDVVNTANPLLSPEDIEEATQDAAQMFENDAKALLENAWQAQFSPIVGMALPIHKLIMMNNVFSQGGGIQRVVADRPSFTVSLERRIMVTPQGDEIDFFTEQSKITDAINATAPTVDFDLTLPQVEGQTDILGNLGGTSLDELSVTTHVSAVFVQGVYFKAGDHLPVDGYFSSQGPIATEADEGPQDVWFRINGIFTPYYGGPHGNDRILNVPITIKYRTSATATAVLKDTLAGTLTKSKIGITSFQGNITKVRLAAKLSTSNAMHEECSVKWDVTTDYVEIPEATPINTTVSPEEVKDIAALYDANQVTKIMSMTKTVLSEYKDMTIKRFLDDSYLRMDERTAFGGEFDFVPPEGYALDYLTWRHSVLMDFIDDGMTRMLQVWNDPNMTVTVYGDPSIIRKVTPRDYTYTAPANIGPVTLDYTQTVVNTTDGRVYNFIGTDKMRDTNELMILLNPKNTERIMYRLYDYQLYISNEIRNAANPSLPSLHSFERFKMYEYMPVQGRLTILNPTGLANNGGIR